MDPWPMLHLDARLVVSIGIALMTASLLMGLPVADVCGQFTQGTILLWDHTRDLTYALYMSRPFQLHN
jgi:hypothetical protein